MEPQGCRAARPASVRIPCTILRFFRVPKIFPVQNSLVGAWGGVPAAGIHANAMLSFPPVQSPPRYSPLQALLSYLESCVSHAEKGLAD